MVSLVLTPILLIRCCCSLVLVPWLMTLPEVGVESLEKQERASNGGKTISMTVEWWGLTPDSRCGDREFLNSELLDLSQEAFANRRKAAGSGHFQRGWKICGFDVAIFPKHWLLWLSRRLWDEREREQTVMRKRCSTKVQPFYHGNIKFAREGGLFSV